MAKNDGWKGTNTTAKGKTIVSPAPTPKKGK
jgi:hypothetical protein